MKFKLTPYQFFAFFCCSTALRVSEGALILTPKIGSESKFMEVNCEGKFENDKNPRFVTSWEQIDIVKNNDANGTEFLEGVSDEAKILKNDIQNYDATVAIGGQPVYYSPVYLNPSGSEVVITLTKKF